MTSDRAVYEDLTNQGFGVVSVYCDRAGNAAGRSWHAKNGTNYLGQFARSAEDWTLYSHYSRKPLKDPEAYLQRRDRFEYTQESPDGAHAVKGVTGDSSRFVQFAELCDLPGIPWELEQALEKTRWRVQFKQLSGAEEAGIGTGQPPLENPRFELLGVTGVNIASGRTFAWIRDNETGLKVKFQVRDVYYRFKCRCGRGVPLLQHTRIVEALTQLMAHDVQRIFIGDLIEFTRRHAAP